jgi:hypothetical protein
MVRKFITTLVIGGFAAFAVGSVSAAGNDCTISKAGGDNAVAKACAKGGIKEAKKTMKAMVKVAKDSGKKWECDTCHKNEEDWKLTGDGEKLFKELLALQK